MEIEWKDNATMYRYEQRNERYSEEMIVVFNPYERDWSWSTTTKYKGASHAAFHEFGSADTIDEAKRLAVKALDRWHAIDSATTSAER